MHSTCGKDVYHVGAEWTGRCSWKRKWCEQNLGQEEFGMFRSWRKTTGWSIESREGVTMNPGQKTGEGEGDAESCELGGRVFIQ